ncbi:MAG: MoaD/ThiS family protein [Chloroflexi bacterium]|nr:MoaD/ThiS family protein [Chloroflexota bacterium]
MNEIVICVRYFNVLADYAGTKRAAVSVPVGTTVRGLLEHLIELSPNRFRHALGSHLRVFHNNQLVSDKSFDTPLADDDEILLFPAVAGGRDG